MEKIEFTNPESKEFNEEVRNYLELMRDTEAIIGDGMEELKGANWAIVLGIPDSSQNCSSWSLISFASLILRIFASFFCLGILFYLLQKTFQIRKKRDNL